MDHTQRQIQIVCGRTTDHAARLPCIATPDDGSSLNAEGSGFTVDVPQVGPGSLMSSWWNVTAAVVAAASQLRSTESVPGQTGFLPIAILIIWQHSKKDTDTKGHLSTKC